MPFGQSGNSRNEGTAAPAPAPSANDGQANNAPAGKAAEPDAMVKGLAFVSMTHNRDGDDGGDEGTPPPQSKQADEDTESGDPGEDANDAGAKTTPAKKVPADDEPPSWALSMQSQMMAMQAELNQWRNGQQPQQQQQKTEEKPAKKAHVQLEFEGEPEEFISRQELYDREKRLIDSINNSFGNAYTGILGSEKQRFYSDYEAARQQHGAAAFDAALPRAEADEIWRQYEQDAHTHGFGKQWRTGFDAVFKQRNHDNATSASAKALAEKDAEIARLKKQVEGQQATKRQAAARLTSGGGGFQQPNTDMKHGVVRSYKQWRPSVVRDMRKNG